ncbi:MAG: DnaJ domain-containing protein [Salinirussus sp.]
MHQRRLVKGLAAAFGVMTALLTVLGLVANLAVLAVALMFGFLTYLFWAHASGRLMGRLYRSVEDRARTEEPGAGAGFGAGPREQWTGPRGGRRVSGSARQARRARGGVGRRGSRRGRTEATDGPTEREAREVLGVESGADESAVREAYRERIKEVHPDADGDEEAFMQVREACDRLTGDGR